ncbi:MAG: hypothetical protein EA342_14685 [Leptolyngbya sp. LCM1.Bin17]|nr:MAG: hypothetical protein EA342_14685 [Leptolyngbya sp. LCM1.Bin17]
MPLNDGRLTISAGLCDGRAFPRVFFYDPISEMIESDKATLNSLLEECRKSGASSTMSVLNFICDIAIATIDIVTTIVTSILTSFVGFGLIGIILVIVMLLLAAYIWVMGIVVALPFILLSTGLRIYKEKTMIAEADKLTQTALRFVIDFLGSDREVQSNRYLKAQHKESIIDVEIASKAAIENID